MTNKASMVPSIVFDGQVYFTTAELGCRCEVCNGRGKLAQGFREALLSLRLRYGRPMPATSVCRCVAHNRSEGGVEDSFHIYENEVGTSAIDVWMQSSVHRADLVELALQDGWRVGITDDFVHLDRAPEYYGVQERKIFLY